MLVSVPLSARDCLPLRAMTTPTLPEEGIVTDTGVTALLWNISVEPESPMSLSDAVARTAGFPSVPFTPSLTKIAAADCGTGFGTAIGRVPLDDDSCNSATRACALSLRTKPPTKNQGRSVSVTFTSTYPAMQGAPFGSVLSPAPASPRQLAE